MKENISNMSIPYLSINGNCIELTPARLHDFGVGTHSRGNSGDPVGKLVCFNLDIVPIALYDATDFYDTVMVNNILGADDQPKEDYIIGRDGDESRLVAIAESLPLGIELSRNGHQEFHYLDWSVQVRFVLYE